MIFDSPPDVNASHVRLRRFSGGAKGSRWMWLDAVISLARRHGGNEPSRGGTGLPSRLVYLWTFPTTAVGLLALVLAAIAGRGVRFAIVEGVLEVHGGPITWFLKNCTPLRGGASAMTLGHVVLGRDELLLDLTRDHERVHVRQAERWGPLFLPAYLLASAAIFLRGGRAYEDNPFEREAFARAPRGGHA
jgi:hypothetical protein